ncbi:MAG TPA: PLP-dependent aspartate aminotransferase family protein [Fimbriimonadaceae bacterium]|nr:PLP-dependent aspartate aminotransferase family protein [Fimbriimonadaceae bacterium]
MDSPESLGIDTVLQHYAEEGQPFGAVVPPIYQSSLFSFEDIDDFAAALSESPPGPPFFYSRIGNPTVDIVERKIAKLEGAEACKLIGTGMGAITMAIFSVVKSGSHCVVVDTCYKPVRQLFETMLARLGVTATFVDGRCPETVFEAVRPETDLIYLESQSSILFRLQSIEAITAFARQRGIVTVIDNTYSTPLYQSPLAMGVDILVHSATKYLAGHSDVTAGAICTSAERVAGMLKEEVNFLGSAIGPFPAWLVLRGLRPLSLRLPRHESTANSLVGWLQDHPRVKGVNHTSLADFEQRELFLKQMKGSAGLFSFELKDGSEAAVRSFVRALRLFKLGVSWGGFESLVVPVLMHPLDWPEPRWVIRLYCGLESPDDLIRDLARGLEAVSNASA